MKNITYYFGAGASSEALPMSNQLADGMTYFKNFFLNKHRNKFEDATFSIVFTQALHELIKDIRKNRSIDALAYRYTLSNEEMKLMKIKYLLSAYLIYEQLMKEESWDYYTDIMDNNHPNSSNIAVEQSIKNKINLISDPRYLHFLMPKLIKAKSRHKYELPGNIKVISWKYDLQFEIALSSITNNNLDEIQEDFCIFPSWQNDFYKDKSCIIKLNGTAGLYNDNSVKRLINMLDLKKDEIYQTLKMLIDIFHRNDKRVYEEPIFAFAWEKDNNIVTMTRSYAKSVIEETEILVIIGYSFPEFNFNIDKEILQNSSRLKKIYYQVPQKDFEECKERLLAINEGFENIPIINKPNTYFFYTPVEYYKG